MSNCMIDFPSTQPRPLTYVSLENYLMLSLNPSIALLRFGAESTGSAHHSIFNRKPL